MFLVLFCSTFSSSTAAITWTIGGSAQSQDRRLAPVLSTSIRNYSSPECVVGGFDTTEPEHVFVGGPCSELDITMENGQITKVKPKANFRYVSMKVFKGGLSHRGVEVPMVIESGSTFMHFHDSASHLEVATAGSAYIVDGTAVSYAGMTVGQATYLSKTDFELKTNSFPYHKTPTTGKIHKIELCITPCCSGAHGCQCTMKESANNCSGENISIKTGEFKFSIFASARDGGIDALDYKPGPSGNGWEGLRAKYGEGIPKALTGNLVIYQAVDFTEMRGDTLTINAPSTTIKYKDMQQWNEADAKQNIMANLYEVKSITVASDGWTANYAFPTTYNGGSWELSQSTDEPEGKLWGVGVVKLYAMKLSNSDLVSTKMAKDDADAEKKKVVFIMYVFDVTGISASHFAGAWYAYDPTITATKGVGFGHAEPSVVASFLSVPTSAGDMTIAVAETSGFTVGQKVVIAKGTSKEESNEIAGFGSIILKFPLKFSHDTGVTFVALSASSDMSDASSQNDTSTTTTSDDHLFQSGDEKELHSLGIREVTKPKASTSGSKIFRPCFFVAFALFLVCFSGDEELTIYE